MSFFTAIKYSDSANLDAFSRLRVSTPQTLLASKQIFSNEPLFFDDQQTSGAGTASVWTADSAASTMSVGNLTAGVRVRQTFTRFNYQPGKSSFVTLTGNLRASGGGTGITTRLGLFDENNGLFFENAAGTVRVVKRTHVSGAPVDTAITQASWNIDKMDGTGASGFNVDWTKSQIFYIDFQWLGVGRARFGLMLSGQLYYIHEIDSANTLLGVYMSTANLPVRFEITNSGTGAASSIQHICATVAVEGGLDPLGVLQYHSTADTHLDANVAGTIYAVLGIRLQADSLGASVIMESTTMLGLTADDFEWLLIFDPTVAGVFTYTDKTNSVVQTATGALANTVTGGLIMTGGHVSANGSIQTQVPSALLLGSSIAGTPQAVVLGVRGHGANLDIHGSMSWRELQ